MGEGDPATRKSLAQNLVEGVLVCGPRQIQPVFRVPTSKHNPPPLAPLDLAYLHIGHGGDEELLSTLRKLWPTTLILNRAGADIATRAKDVEDGLADVVTVGTMALANPDLVERVRSGSP
ncbi:hypothetical protein [Streptomyces sp. NPDC012510]|uniref:hypothetical protein n=1 Tax=Streptomyces sp. NPDC012510 TaxID=3364838 RepID=UPI0036E9E4EE